MTEFIALVAGKSKDWVEVESVLMALDYRIHLAQPPEDVRRLTEKTDCPVVIFDPEMIEKLFLQIIEEV